MTTRVNIRANIRKIGRAGMLGTLATGMIISLASCGTAEPASGAIPTATASAAMSMLATATSDDPMSAMPSVSSGATAISGSSDIQSTPAQSDGSAVVIQATLKEWSLDLSQKEAPAGKVRFVVTNAGQMTHNLTVISSDGMVGRTDDFRSSDGQQVLELDLKPGTYSIICGLLGHAARGQRNELVVK